ncbi:MAG: hypothetical protein ACREM9_09435 [Gemmatimonadales bacterium]
MTKRSTAGLVAAGLLVGTLACAGTGLPKDEVGAAPDTSGQNPPGYRGMEQDTTQVPTDSQPSASDTFLQEQGTGVPEDTAGYSGLEQPDTTGAVSPDTSGVVAPDTSGAGWDDTTGAPGVDTSGMSGMSDTTGQQ